jgi:hypothetical protein
MVTNGNDYHVKPFKCNNHIWVGMKSHNIDVR